MAPSASNVTEHRGQFRVIDSREPRHLGQHVRWFVERPVHFDLSGYALQRDSDQPLFVTEHPFGVHQWWSHRRDSLTSKSMSPRTELLEKALSLRNEGRFNLSQRSHFGRRNR